jgi:hypothetical protein
MNDYKKIYLHPVKDFEEHKNDKILIKNRIVLRFYLLEFLNNQ